jgi:hypothetical protein
MQTVGHALEQFAPTQHSSVNITGDDKTGMDKNNRQDAGQKPA